MKKLLVIAALLAWMSVPVSALELEIPTVPEVRSSGAENFAQDLLIVLRDALDRFQPDLREAGSVCVRLLAVVAALAVFTAIPEKDGAVRLAGAVLVAALLLEPAHALIALGAQTVEELSEYEKLLLPVLTAALAAQGGVGTSAALYAGTAAFHALLSTLIAKVLVPFVYLYLALAVANGAVGEALLKKMQDSVRSVAVWGLKTILYVYTGYITITGVVSGTTDASLLKAAKLTISGAVPVVGGILSDASEAVLVSAAVVKNAAGIYGLLAVLALWIGPFLRIGAHYLLIKAVGAVSGVFGVDAVSGIMDAFASAMGLLLAMTGAVCLMLMIGTICFMRGVGL